MVRGQYIVVRGRMKKQAGFTLIEIIVVLIIGGIMITVAGMALVTGMKGYLFARDNAAIAQNAPLAMTRLSRELMELTNITDYTSSLVSYERPDDSGNSIPLTIYLDSDSDSDNHTIKIAPGVNPSGGDILVDRVNSFNLDFYSGNSWSASYPVWLEGEDIQDLSYITIVLDLERTDGSIISFSTTVNPRNTGG